MDRRKRWRRQANWNKEYKAATYQSHLPNHPRSARTSDDALVLHPQMHPAGLWAHKITWHAHTRGHHEQVKTKEYARSARTVQGRTGAQGTIRTPKNALPAQEPSFIGYGLCALIRIGAAAPAPEWQDAYATCEHCEQQGDPALRRPYTDRLLLLAPEGHGALGGELADIPGFGLPSLRTFTARSGLSHHLLPTRRSKRAEPSHQQQTVIGAAAHASTV